MIKKKTWLDWPIRLITLKSYLKLPTVTTIMTSFTKISRVFFKLKFSMFLREFQAECNISLQTTINKSLSWNIYSFKINKKLTVLINELTYSCNITDNASLLFLKSWGFIFKKFEEQINLILVFQTIIFLLLSW